MITTYEVTCAPRDPVTHVVLVIRGARARSEPCAQKSKDAPTRVIEPAGRNRSAEAEWILILGRGSAFQTFRSS